MKILFVSLLRLGDLLMHRNIIRFYQQVYPEAQLDAVIFDVSKAGCGILNEVKQWYCIERSQMQKEMNHPQTWIFRPYMQLTSLIRDLQDQNYDLVVNLTHTNFSAALMGAMLYGAKAEAKGLHFDGTLRVPKGLLQTPGMKYFNDIWSQTPTPDFHYIEALSLSLGLPLNLPQNFSNLSQTKKIEKIYFQILTSDAKKNLPFETWHALFGLLERQNLNLETAIITSPADHGKLQAQFPTSQFLVCDLLELQNALTDNTLLVTLDTSVLHLAQWTPCEVIQISVGSSQALKTSSLKEGTTAISGIAPCYPCAHAAPCNRPSHDCSLKITPEMVVAEIRVKIFGLRKFVNPAAARVEIKEGIWILQGHPQQKSLREKNKILARLLNQNEISRDQMMEKDYES